MKNLFVSLLFCIGCCVCKGQDTIRYAIKGSFNTRLIKMNDSISVSIFSKEKNLQYRIVNVKLSFKRYDMKMLKTIRGTVINFPEKFSKNPVAIFKPGDIPIFAQADVLTITLGDVIKKNKRGKTDTAVNVFGKEKELQIVK